MRAKGSGFRVQGPGEGQGSRVKGQGQGSGARVLGSGQAGGSALDSQSMSLGYRSALDPGLSTLGPEPCTLNPAPFSGPWTLDPGPCLGDLLHEGREYLQRHGLEEAALEAEVLLMDVMGISRAYLYAHGEERAGPKDVEEYRRVLDRRARREPLAYITRNKEFFSLDLYVDRRVLVPRPETETLVEECLRVLGRTGPQAPLLADVGTGCGAIAVALAQRLPRARVYATDISPEALSVARFNCLLHGMRRRVVVLQGNLLEPLPEPVDMILANLPYVPADTLQTLAPEIALYEPRMALDGGRDGLDLIRGLVAQGPGRLRPGGRILLEIGANQAASVAEAVAKSMPRAKTRVVPDLAGLDRVMVIELVS